VFAEAIHINPQLNGAFDISIDGAGGVVATGGVVVEVDFGGFNEGIIGYFWFCLSSVKSVL
jgi:hypothetical protein